MSEAIDSDPIKLFNIVALLELSPSNFYLRQMLSLPSGPDWVSLPFFTKFEESVVTVSEDTPPKFIVEKNDDIKKFHAKVVKKICSIFTIYGIDLEKEVNKKDIIKQLAHGTLVGKNSYVSNLEYILLEFITHLKATDNPLLEDTIATTHRVIYWIKNQIDFRSFIYYPKNFNLENSNRYYKINSAIKDVVIKDRNNMMAYCYTLRQYFINSEKVKSEWFTSYLSFFARLLTDYESVKNITILLSPVVREVVTETEKKVYIRQELKQIVKFHILSAALDEDSDDLPHWKNRMFGKGFSLFKKMKNSDDGYDVEKFIIEFNLMLEARSALNQAYHN